MAATNNESVRELVAEKIEEGQTFTNRQVLAEIGNDVTIHAVRRVTRELTNARRLVVVGHVGKNGRTEVYGPGQYAERA